MYLTYKADLRVNINRIIVLKGLEVLILIKLYVYFIITSEYKNLRH